MVSVFVDSAYVHVKLSPHVPPSSAKAVWGNIIIADRIAIIQIFIFFIVVLFSCLFIFLLHLHNFPSLFSSYKQKRHTATLRLGISHCSKARRRLRRLAILDCKDKHYFWNKQKISRIFTIQYLWDKYPTVVTTWRHDDIYTNFYAYRGNIIIYVRIPAVRKEF